MGAAFAREVVELLLDLPNSHRIERFFRWNLLHDVDDNKFVDCAIAAGAQLIVTEDSDFRKLRNADLLGLQICNINQFALLF